MTEPKSAYSVDGKVPYKDSSISPEERVKDLLSRMTLEEKVVQMMGLWNEKNETLVNENRDFEIMVGNSSRDEDLKSIILNVS